MPKNKTAEAAVAKNTTFTYAQVDARQYRKDNSAAGAATVPYSSFSSTVNTTYGVADFTSATKTAHVTKNTSQDIVGGYVVFSASLDVPAMTEYNVTFSYNFTMVRTVTSADSTINVAAELFFFGETDNSSSLNFNFFNTTPQSSPDFVKGFYWDTKAPKTKTFSDTASTSAITFTNNTSALKTYTVYFGLFGGCGRGTSYKGAVDATVTLSEKVTVTALTPPAVDIASAQYNGANQFFTFTYDNARVAVTKAEYTPSTGAMQTLYDASTSTGSNPVNGSGVMQAKDAGTYTVYFDILNDCGAVWNSATDDQATKKVTFTITKKKLKIPTVSASQQYTGSPLTFSLIDFNNGQDIKTDSVTSAVPGHTVTDTSGNVPTDTTGVFLATSVDKYTVLLSPRDTNNYEWDDAAGGSGAKPVVFEVTQKELLSSPPVSSKVNTIGGAEWEYGDGTVTVTVTDDRISGENVDLLCYYDVAGGTSKSNTLTAVTTGNASVITMPANIAVGTYTLTVELNGTTGNNANYKITTNNTLNFEITSGRLDPTAYGWIYTKDGAAGSTIANNDKLPFVLKTGSLVDGVKYEVSIQIPASHTSVIVDTSKYVNGYLTRSGDRVNTYATTVALKSTDPAFMFEDAGGNKSATAEVTLNWEIEKGTFDLSAVKWEYSTDGAAWTDYDSSNPPQYNDGNYITLRVKASTLPAGLTLDSLYVGSEEYDVDNYVATIAVSDFVYNSSNFNAPDVSLLTFGWEIAKKNLYTGFKNVKDSYSNANGSGTVILKELNVDPAYASYITYKYYDMSTGAEVSLSDIKNAVDPTNEKRYKIEAYIDSAVAANFSVEDGGNVPSDTFVTGSKNKLATATIDGSDGTAPILTGYDGNTHFDISLIKIKGDDGIDVTDFTVKYYAGGRPVAGNELASGALPEDAGEYCVEITLGSVAEKKYILATDWFTVKIEPKGIEIPTLGEMVFTGSEINFEDYLGGSWETYKNVITVDGKKSDRNVGASDYVTTLTLNSTNYKWTYPSSTPAPTKALAKYALTDGAVTGDDTVATYTWNITPLVVDTTNMWNKGKEGATLNLPQNIKDLISAGTLEVGYRYYDGEGNYIETPELKGGRSFKVEAVFGGDDAQRNVAFKRSETETGATSAGIDYTVPQGGAAAFFGNALSFVKSNWLWFVIALAILIFLIILICIIRHRKKTKEERLAKKEAKEEEKRRKEEEREAEKRRREQELELEKAKQEAELAKMRAQAGMAGAGVAAMGAMAMAQQPQAQMPQQMPMQAQMQQYPQTPSYQSPAQAQPPMPQQPYPQMQQGMDGASNARLTQLEMEVAKMKAESDIRTVGIDERAKMAYFAPVPQVMPQAARYEERGGNKAMTAEILGEAIFTAIAKLVESKAAPKEIPQSVEESKPLSVSYPPDAVVTTTTRVDTTKNKQVTPRSDDGRMFDVDGFYDTFDEK